MSELKKLLQQYVDNPKKNYNQKDYMGNRGYIVKEYSSSELQPMTFEEMKGYRTIFGMESTFKHIPPALYNKTIDLGEFQLIFQHQTKFRSEPNNAKSTVNSIGYAMEYHTWEIYCNVILVHRGIYTRIAKYSDSMGYRVNRVVPEQRNWHWLTFTADKNYMLDEDTSYLQFSEYDKTKDIINAINLDEVVLENKGIDFQPWYSYDSDREYKHLTKYTAKSIDAEFFISSETKDGVYKPEPHTIKEVIYQYGKYFNKDLLTKLGIHTIQLRTNAHYPIETYFNIPKGCVIKAAKSVIKTYGYEKYTDDTALVEEIKADKKAEKAKQKTLEYNNKFTLMQHGKVIMENKDKYKLIEYLENFIAKDVDSTVLDTIKPIFDKFDIETFYIGYWGTYPQYELRGQKCGFNEDVYSHNAKEMDEDVLDEIYELYQKNIPTLEDKEVELAYGWPDDGIELLGVRKNKKGKLETFTTDYDLM